MLGMICTSPVLFSLTRINSTTNLRLEFYLSILLVCFQFINRNDPFFYFVLSNSTNPLYVPEVGWHREYNAKLIPSRDILHT
jgi:hypothetical protein